MPPKKPLSAKEIMIMNMRKRREAQEAAEKAQQEQERLQREQDELEYILANKELKNEIKESNAIRQTRKEEQNNNNIARENNMRTHMQNRLLANTSIIMRGEDEEVIVEAHSRKIIACVFGHVNAGKTTLLDRLNGTNVCHNENNHITQHIRSVIRGNIMFIDTPGHEAFLNLRSQGVSICDVGIVVVDIMKGLEKQTIECLDMLRENNCQIILVMNKIDRLYEWTYSDGDTFQESYNKQNRYALEQYSVKIEEIRQQLGNEPIDSVATSCFGRNGIGLDDLLNKIEQIPSQNISYNFYIFDVVAINNVGVVMHVIIKNGTLSVGDVIKYNTIYGTQVSTTIRTIIANDHYVREVSDLQMAYIVADNINGAIGKLCLANQELETNTNCIQFNQKGVVIYSKSLGSAMSLAAELKTENITVAEINTNTTIPSSHIPRIKTPVICFDMDLPQNIIDNLETVINGKTIFELKQRYLSWVSESNDKLKDKVIYPVELKILQSFRGGKQLILGCKIQSGFLKIGTPLYYYVNNTAVDIGEVIEMQMNNAAIETANIGAEIGLKINNPNNLTYGRQLPENAELKSRLTRQTIDILKKIDRDNVVANVGLIKKIKKELNII